eukprot:gene43410-28242_t
MQGQLEEEKRARQAMQERLEEVEGTMRKKEEKGN